MPTRRFGISLLLLLGLTSLAACSGVQTGPPATANYKGADYYRSEGTLFGPNGMTLFSNAAARDKQRGEEGGGVGGGSLGVNAYLWRGALDTLSFMPLASADPFGGVIITDWYTPPATPGERFKATAYVLGGQLRSNGVRVSIFRQVLQNGQWVDAPVSNVTVSDIENKVLARARQLRAQSQASS